jgi:hypothetical protein
LTALTAGHGHAHMVQMGRVLRSSAALVAGLALVAMLPAPCPCPEEAAAPRSGHECCAPPAGVSASDHGCCDTGPGAAEGVTSATGGDAPVPSQAVEPIGSVRRAGRLVASATTPSASPPIPLVLRI